MKFYWLFKATPHKLQSFRLAEVYQHILWITSAVLPAKAHWLKPPGRACQPESSLPVQTGYWISLAAFQALGIVSFGSAAAFWQHQIHALLLPGQTILRAPPSWQRTAHSYSFFLPVKDDDWFYTWFCGLTCSWRWHLLAYRLPDSRCRRRQLALSRSFFCAVLPYILRRVNIYIISVPCKANRYRSADSSWRARN